MNFIRLASLLILTIAASNLFAQTAVLVGDVYDSSSKPLHYANVSVVDFAIGTTTDKKGHFEINVPASVEIKIEISYLSYETYSALLLLSPGENFKLEVKLGEAANMLPGADVVANTERHGGAVRLNPDISLKIPTMGGFEDI